MPGQAKSQGAERGTAPPEERTSNADLVYEPVDDGWPGYEELSSTQGNCKLPYWQLVQDAKLRNRSFPRRAVSP